MASAGFSSSRGGAGKNACEGDKQMDGGEEMDIIRDVEKRLEQAAGKGGLITGQVRDISAEVYRLIKDKDIENVLGLCGLLLEERKWETGVVAYDWAFRVRKQYSEETFYIFERWLKDYVRGWGDCDDFCTHAFGELLSRYTEMFPLVVAWTDHPDFWVRRAAAVILIYSIRKGRLQNMDPFSISDRLMQDEHPLVLKGYGWMLKVLSCYRTHEVYDYLMKSRNDMPRISLRYAIEKLDSDRRVSLMEKPFTS